MYLLLHKKNGLYYNSRQFNPPVPFGGPKETADQFVDKEMTELMVENAKKFFDGLFPQDMDMMNRNAFIKECIVVDAEE